MGIDFSLPKQKWFLNHQSPQNETEKFLLYTARQIQEDSILHITVAKNILKEELFNWAELYKLRQANANFVKIDIEDCNTTIVVRTPRFSLNKNGQVTDQYYATFLKLQIDDTQTKK